MDHDSRKRTGKRGGGTCRNKTYIYIYKWGSIYEKKNNTVKHDGRLIRTKGVGGLHCVAPIKSSITKYGQWTPGSIKRRFQLSD